MSERKLRFGVIGAGGFAEVCHVPGLQTHSRAEVVAWRESASDIVPMAS